MVSVICGLTVSIYFTVFFRLSHIILKNGRCNNVENGTCATRIKREYRL